ncbi:MAG TPA: pseudouridine-5'-phosphate glycosidase [Gemmatimonadaceae bacterium]
MSSRVARALRSGRPVVALESSVLAQGLPRPANAEAADRMLQAVTAAGAVPAITAVVRGTPAAGLDVPDLRRFLSLDGIPKVSARDLATAVATGSDGATTVAAALVLAHRAGIAVFATGGIGGVHRGGGYDESADLVELSRTPVVVVCAGPKAILDVAATAERLESLGVTVVGFRTDTMPAFYTIKSAIPVTRVESVAEVATIYAAHRALDRPGAVLVVQPPPAATALPVAAVERAVGKGLRAAARSRVRGGAVTPFLLRSVAAATRGRSLTANLALLESNARLAAEIAVAVTLARNNR